MPSSIRCTPFAPSIPLRIATDLLEVQPLALPATPLADRWRLQPCILPAAYDPMAEAIASFPVRPDDLWIASYPECGTRWTQQMLRLLLTDLDYARSERIPLDTEFSYLEASMWSGGCGKAVVANGGGESVDSVQQLRRSPSPRLIRTHLPIELLPTEIWTVRPRLVYVTRNPQDAVIQLYEQYRREHGYRGSSDEFAAAFLSEEVIYSPFAPHVYNYWLARHEPNVLFVTFEQMRENMMQVLRVAQDFVGKRFGEAELAELAAHLGDQMQEEEGEYC